MSFYLSDLLNVAGCQLSGVSLEDSPLVSSRELMINLVRNQYRIGKSLNRAASCA